ncbi:MAG TPA: hypothetical protein VEO53_06540 [Candidatus Binatia bacterium]|nr:hypothetical protein [Candidatus Binatia bacterium]
MVADSAAALEIKPEDAGHFSHLVAETGALFGARHYRQYHFLLTLSEHVAHFGLEHHQSSDNRVGERFLIDEEARKLSAILLPHEMTHSWNGKYRRPAGLATLDFHQPMKGELLWVYEGLTDYLGVVLAARSGLWTNENAREDLALNAARLDYQTGRNWRPLADTTVAAQLLYFARPEGTAWRRSVDFYPEGDLIWLEADVLIRQQTQGRSSLDDFCQRDSLGAKTERPRSFPTRWTTSWPGSTESLRTTGGSSSRRASMPPTHTPRSVASKARAGGWFTTTRCRTCSSPPKARASSPT